MMKRFNFEAEIYESLSCVPMAARRKLDRVGVKISLEQWQHLSRGERLMVCHAPAQSADECDALRMFLEEASLARSGSKPKDLPEAARRGAEPPSSPPPELITNARQAGTSLSQAEWDLLDEDQRYALVKLGAGSEPSHNLKAALAEFIAPRAHSHAANS